MGLLASDTREFSFDRTVYIRFPERKDFTLAPYLSLSLTGFSCTIPKALPKGEVVRVEVNLKMISGGALDDRELHWAKAELVEILPRDGKLVHVFRFVSFEGTCMDLLVKALSFLEEKEKIMMLPVFPGKGIPQGQPPDLTQYIRHIMENVKTGRVALPVLPRIVRDVDALVNDPESSVEDLAKVIERDAVISVKILATANSLFYRGRTHLVSIRETLPRLGFKEIRNLVLTIASKGLYTAKVKTFQMLLDRLWQHSLVCAHLSRSIAQALSLPDTDRFYLSGLVHDIGKTVIYSYLSQMLHKKPVPEPLEIIHAVESNHFEMTEIILRHWGFSSDFIHMVKSPDSQTGDVGKSRSLHVVHAANLLSRNMGFDLMDGAVDLSAHASVRSLGLSPGALGRIAEQVREMMDGAGQIF